MKLLLVFLSFSLKTLAASSNPDETLSLAALTTCTPTLTTSAAGGAGADLLPTGRDEISVLSKDTPCLNPDETLSVASLTASATGGAGVDLPSIESGMELITDKASQNLISKLLTFLSDNSDKRGITRALDFFEAYEKELLRSGSSEWENHYYMVLVNSLCELIYEEICKIKEKLAAHPELNPIGLFKEVLSYLNRVEVLYTKSRFTFKEEDNVYIKGLHQVIVHSILDTYIEIVKLVSSYSIENPTFFKEIAEKVCEYAKRTSYVRGSIVGDDSKVMDDLWAYTNYRHALMLVDLYQMPNSINKNRNKYPGIIRSIQKTLKHNNKYARGFDALIKALGHIDEKFAIKTKISDPSNSKKLKTLFEKNLNLHNIELFKLLEEASEVGGPIPAQSLINRIQYLQAQLTLYRSSLATMDTASTEHDARDLEMQNAIEQTIKDIIKEERKEIRATAKAGAGGAPEEISLLEMYYKYCTYFPYCKPIIIKNSLVQIRNGQFREALERLTILRRIQEERGEELGVFGDWVIALCQGYMGDWEPYNDIYAKLISDGAAITEETAARKAKAQEALAIRARAAQQAAEQKRLDEERKRLDIKAAEKAPRGLKAVLMLTPEEKIRRAEEAAENARMHATEKAEAALQLAALKARLAEEDKRREDEVSKRSTATALDAGGVGVAAPSPKSIEVLELDEAAIDLTSLFRLSGTSRKVEEEIVGKTWRIKKDDLITYFSNLGCTTRNAKGAHKIVELPEMTEILIDGQVLAVIPQEGGSGTLPSWEGDHFPHYLINQISLLRSILAISAAKKATELKTAVADTD